MGTRAKSRQASPKDGPANAVQKKVEAALIPIGIVSTIAAAVSTLVVNLSTLATSFKASALLTSTALTSASILLALYVLPLGLRKWLGPRPVLVVKMGSVVAIVASYFIFLINPPTCLLGCGPSDWRPIRLGLVLSPAYAAEGSGLSVVDVAIDADHSTFSLSRTTMSIHAVDNEAPRLSVEFDRRMYNAFHNASCIGMEGETPIEDALPVWRSLLKARGRDDLASKLASYAGYRSMIQTGGPNAFNDARPNTAELADLLKQKPEWYNIVLRWMAKCVGIADPVLIWTIQNSTNKQATISAVDYNILDVGQVKGGGPDTIEPVDVQPHDLPHRKGVVHQNLSPYVVIQPGQVARIRIRYRLEATDFGFTWLFQPTFRTVDDSSAVGPELKIFSAKNPNR
jgi:hypothetical protein